MIEKELTFLSSYGNMVDEHYRNVADFILSCQCIAKEHFDRKSHSKEDRYNIFRIISNLYYRENFHSDIIAFFLDPNGNHGCKHLMLDLFISMLNKAGCDIDYMDYSDAVVVREEARIDILISSEENKKAIVIENKINNAGDMPRQLPRYYDYVTKNYILDAIVYLPLSFNKTPNMNDWTEMDKKHILPLLKVIYDRFNGSCSPFEKVWIYKSWDAVFEKAIVNDIYLKMDIWCYEERYDVVF